MTHGIFDERVAAGYDAASAEMFRPEALEPAVDFLAGLVGHGRALELAIGTGRVAIPLAARGVEVAGIELSQPMVDQMAGKPGADSIAVTIGDMTTARVAGPFQLVYLVYNTITNLLTQEEQVACFRNAEAHLAPGGHFAIEVFIPQLQRLPVGERFIPFHISEDHLGIDEYDLVNQLVTSHHYWIGDHRNRRFASPHRYGWPAEYDLMATLAGLALSERWRTWSREPFTAESTSHISVWTKPQLHHR